MSISAKDVKKLRDHTGAGMMDCKKALKEADGDFDKAIEVLRKKGQKLSAKRADRDAKEGVVMALVNDDQTKGVVIKLSCETDFVAKNEDFVQLAKEMATIALKEFPTSKEELLKLKLNDITIGEKVTEQIGVIGEKIELADYERMESDMVVSYIHMGHKAGVILGLNKPGEAEEKAGRDVAMQVAAMRPVGVSKEDVPQETIDKELEIGREIALKEGKPDNIVDKIAQGKLNKFFKENTLLHQAYVKESKMTVEQYLKSINPDLTVTGFKHIELG
ncbi:MAG: elongation factor Ts [Bacteroidetes bacterium]|jgi:elongation factor Ts|nr:elongation factor Ts [Bacteroidota bacterium]